MMKAIILSTLIFTTTLLFGQTVPDNESTILESIHIDLTDGRQIVELNNDLGKLIIVVERAQITSVSRSQNGRDYPLQQISTCNIPNALSCWKDDNQNLTISVSSSVNGGKDIIVSRDDKDKH